MLNYNYRDFGISEAEYEMLCQAINQGIVTKRNVESSLYSFRCGEETVASFINRLDYSLSFRTNIVPVRDHISQQEFENICNEVIVGFPKIEKIELASMRLSFQMRSHSGRSSYWAIVDFNDGGYITGHNWTYSNTYGENLPHFVGKRISNKIISALYRF